MNADEFARADEAVVVARIGKPHGLRGEVTVQLHTDDPERIERARESLAAAVTIGPDAVPPSPIVWDRID